MSVVSEVRAGTDVVGRECLARQMVGLVEEVSEAGFLTVALAGVSVRDVTGVPLPRVGEVVEVRHGGACVRGVWVGLRCPLPADGEPVTVRVLVDSEVVQAEVEPGALDSRNSVVGAVDREARWAALAVGQLGAELDSERTRNAVWRAGFAERAREAADRNNLCAVFDDFMSEEGLEERLYRYTVQVSVTQTVQIDVEASSEENAQDSVDQVAVSAAVDASTVDWTVDCAEQGDRVN